MAKGGSPSHARHPDQPSARRVELLAIAADLFAERGFAGVTVDELGAAAGVSGPALYHHFDSKEALLGEMLVRISQTLLDQSRTIVQTRAPPERLGALVRMQVDFAVDQRSLITVHLRDLVHVSEPDSRRVRDLQRAYVDIWVAALLHLRPSMGARRARASVHAALGLINSTPFSGRLRRDDMFELLRAMAMGALTAVAAPDDRPLSNAVGSEG
jgi:AcrR family transcriptional regulator